MSESSPRLPLAIALWVATGLSLSALLSLALLVLRHRRNSVLPAPAKAD